jgi:hypothetical protein
MLAGVWCEWFIFNSGKKLVEPRVYGMIRVLGSYFCGLKTDL